MLIVAPVVNTKTIFKNTYIKINEKGIKMICYKKSVIHIRSQ